MKAQWFLVTGRVYESGRDRFGTGINTHVLVVNGRIAAFGEDFRKALQYVGVGSPWDPKELEGMTVQELPES